MSGILNLVIVGLVLLIAYWWANQGLFSAVMHCLCVIVAGAIALAFWEPIVVKYLLPVSQVDNYSWGLTLGGLFVVSLFILRTICDKVAPNNVKFPDLVNTLVGGAVGLWAGVLTMGMAAIACGMMQGPVEIVGFIGWARDGNNNGAPNKLNSMWLPVANITERFYATLSRGSLSPIKPTALYDYYPNLADTALSLNRDTFFDGEGRVSIKPDSVTLGSVTFDSSYSLEGENPGAYAVEFTVDSGAFDGGEQFVLSSAQARLVTKSSPGAKPARAFPKRFIQPAPGGARESFLFDDLSNYATSVPGEQEAKFVLVFPTTEFGGAQPQFFFLKGLRFDLSRSLVASPGAITAMLGASEEEPAPEQDDSRPEGGYVDDVSNFVAITNSIMPVQINTNSAAPMTIGTNKDGNFLSGGKGIYRKGSAMTINRGQRVSGFYHSAGTEVIMVDASRISGGIDIYGDGSAAFKALGRDLPLEILDGRGKAYKPVGYVWERRDDVELLFEPGKPIQRLSDLPNQPSSGEHKLKLVFVVPEGVTITGIRLGKTVIGRCDVVVGKSITD